MEERQKRQAIWDAIYEQKKATEEVERIEKRQKLHLQVESKIPETEEIGEENK